MSGIPAKSQAEKAFYCFLTWHLEPPPQESVGSGGEERVGSRIALEKLARGEGKSSTGRGRQESSIPMAKTSKEYRA